MKNDLIRNHFIVKDNKALLFYVSKIMKTILDFKTLKKVSLKK